LFTLSDTVGFVRNLPHQLVEAFRSTLEEVGKSDVIVHVVDASHPDPAAQLTTVRNVIGELDARHIPEIVVFNKSDLADEDQKLLLRGLEPRGIFVSARTGDGIDELLERIAELLPSPEVEVSLLVPYDHGDVISRLHVQGRVISTDYLEEGTRVTALVHPQRLGELRQYMTASVSHRSRAKLTEPSFAIGTERQPSPAPAHSDWIAAEGVSGARRYSARGPRELLVRAVPAAVTSSRGESF
jgi:GTP-binding protein HflX